MNLRELKSININDYNWVEFTGRYPLNATRNKDILKSYVEGFSMSVITDFHNLSRERVRQILMRYSRLLTYYKKTQINERYIMPKKDER